MRIGHLIVIAALAGVAGAASAQPPGMMPPGMMPPDLRPPVVVDGTSGPARLQLGQLIEVRLPVQAGTGYSWFADDTSSKLEYIDESKYHPWGEPQLMGGKQTQMFIYRAIAPGAATLRFAYRRPWLPGEPPAQTAEQRVIIMPWRR